MKSESQKVLETLNELRATSSSISKLNILRNNETDLLKKVLYYAYNPYFTYNIRYPQNPDLDYPLGLMDGSEVFDNCLFDTLDHIILGDVPLRKCKDRLHALILSYDGDVPITRIINKDLRIGINAKSINKVFKDLIPTFDVMLASKLNHSKLIYPVAASIKYDGIRAILSKGTLYTRSGKILIGLDHISKMGKPGVVYDGELIIPGMGFNEASGLIRSNNPVPNAVYMIFDERNSIWPFNIRQQSLESDPWIKAYSCLIHVKNTLCHDPYEVIDFYGKCRKEGYEGAIIKNTQSLYEFRRSPHWQKMKELLSEDLKCTGVYQGTGKYEGSGGGIYVDRKGVEIKVGGGFTDHERRVIWVHPENFIGQIAEIEFQEVTPAGSFRHPRFKAWRWDKE